MPVILPSRQPGPGLDWFGSTPGQGLLAVEFHAMARVLSIGPARPWLWIGLEASTPPDGARGVRLRRRRGLPGFGGDVRCALPLPLASETFGTVLIQHALDDVSDHVALLSECERVLAPGGTLWLAALNPWSPYRSRWAGSGLKARDPGRWQAALRRAGFSLEAVSLQWLGPRWRSAHGAAGVGAADRLRAGQALTVTKRMRSVIPLAPARALRWQAGVRPGLPRAGREQVGDAEIHGSAARSAIMGR